MRTGHFHSSNLSYHIKFYTSNDMETAVRLLLFKCSSANFSSKAIFATKNGVLCTKFGSLASSQSDQSMHASNSGKSSYLLRPQRQASSLDAVAANANHMNSL